MLRRPYAGWLSLIFSLLVGVSLIGCGQKGALYLPEEKAMVQQVR